MIEMYEPHCLVTCCMQVAIVQDLCMCSLPLLCAASFIVRNVIILCYAEQGIKDDLLCVSVPLMNSCKLHSYDADRAGCFFLSAVFFDSVMLKMQLCDAGCTKSAHCWALQSTFSGFLQDCC